MPETRDLILDALRGQANGLSGGQVAAAVPHLYAAQAGHILAAMAFDGLLERVATHPPRYRLAPDLRVVETRERVAVTVDAGQPIDDPLVVDEIEAEKLWNVAARVYAARVHDERAAGFSMADHVDDAAALIAASRARVASDRARRGEG